MFAVTATKAPNKVRNRDRLIERLGGAFHGPGGRELATELQQFLLGVALDEERNEVADGAALEAAVLVQHKLRYECGVHLVRIGQSASQLVDDLLFTQLDH